MAHKGAFINQLIISLITNQVVFYRWLHFFNVDTSSKIVFNFFQNCILIWLKDAVSLNTTLMNSTSITSKCIRTWHLKLHLHQLPCTSLHIVSFIKRWRNGPKASNMDGFAHQSYSALMSGVIPTTPDPKRHSHPKENRMSATGKL